MIVLLETGSNHKEDRAWSCQTETEAKTMLCWLRDNHIKAKVITTEEYDALPNYKEDNA